MIENAGFEAVKRDTIYNRAESVKRRDFFVRRPFLK